MSKRIKVIHISEKKSELSCLSELFEYIWVPLFYDFLIDEQELALFPHGLYNPSNHNAIFIIENYAKIVNGEKKLIEQLPAHRIILSKEASYQRETQRIFDLKGAVRLSTDSFEKVEQYLNENFLIKQEGYKLNSQYINVQPGFKGEVVRQGNTYIELSGIFPDKMTQIMTWKMTTVIGENDRFEFYPEFELVDGLIDLVFKIFLFKENSREIIDCFNIPVNDTRKKEKVIIKNTMETAYMSISLYAKGNIGKIRIGSVHLRKALRKNDTLLPGGQAIYDPEKLNGELLYYFEPGDFKPPLAVYFSGYRPAEGFEGRRMMSSMGCPFLLVADPRLEGGSFYMGSSSLETKIVDIIKEKLDLLRFDRSQLVLSGLSMGTFGALYYAADLQPKSVIVGKPLTDVGDIAVNGRIRRPNEFSTALDILFAITNDVSLKAAKQLNKKFWKKFIHGDYKDTNFAIAYMKDDDYDKMAFPRLFKVIKKNSPSTKLLYKGLVGRHNDNSPEINSWFLKQYRNVMVHKFNRIPSTFK
ncbi:accessory Sec system protein Asp2 [Enterococcus sp. LJL99]